MGLIAHQELSVGKVLGVPELAQKEWVVADGHMRLEGGPLLLVVRAELPSLEILTLRVPVARVLLVLVVLLEAEVVGTVGELPVHLAPPLVAGQLQPRRGRDKTAEVRLALHDGVPKVRSILVLE